MEDSPERKSGCGLLSAVFGRRSVWPKKSLPAGGAVVSNVKAPVNSVSSISPEPAKNQTDRIIARPGPNHQKNHPPHQHPQNICAQSQGKPAAGMKNENQSKVRVQGKKVPQGTIGISGELDSMINDHQRSKGAGNLVRASSGNLMLFGHLGNLRQPGAGVVAGGDLNPKNRLNCQPKTGKEEEPSNGLYPNSERGSFVKKRSEITDKPTSLCRALSTRMDPEELKIMGNEDYKNGRFGEALALYEAAISINPNKASYRSNKSAALNALGRVLEAVFECREAIRIDRFYPRAHNRLATLYLRLGDAEKAMYHYKQAGAESDPDILSKAKALQLHLSKCTEAKKHRDWNTLLRETAHAVSIGADSAPQIFALQAEALLKMHRHQDADEALTKSPNFDIDDCTRFFGPVGNASLLVVRAQVDMTSGRFDDAIVAAQRAAQLDSNSREVNVVVRRTRVIAMARSTGNELFREQRYSEACAAYEEGLDHDPYNSILLCNRAACRAKLGHFERAIEDCTMALNVRPSYRKARLRRADCYAKLGKWEACVEDYEVMKGETPDDVDVIEGLKDAQRRRLGKPQPAPGRET